jgi:hypothetical protein
MQDKQLIYVSPSPSHHHIYVFRDVYSTMDPDQGRNPPRKLLTEEDLAAITQPCGVFAHQAACIRCGHERSEAHRLDWMNCKERCFLCTSSRHAGRVGFILSDRRILLTFNSPVSGCMSSIVISLLRNGSAERLGFNAICRGQTAASWNIERCDRGVFLI